MFGGLDIKGGGGDKKKDNHATAAAPPSTAAPAAAAPSAFSFLQGFSSSPTAAADDAVAAAPAASLSSSSGFSFLASGSAAAPSATSAAPASAFGFMSTSTTATGTAEAVPSTENGTASSGFNFLHQPSEAAKPVDALPSTGATTAASTSAFNFMASSGVSADAVSTISRESPALSESGLSISSSNTPTAVDFMSSLSSVAPPPAPLPSLSSPSLSSPPPPAGAGVVFGGAAAAKNTIKKKRNRTSRIGVGAHAPGALPPPAAAVTTASRPPLPEPSAATTAHPPAQPPAASAVPPTRASSTTPPVDTAAAALEAQERAERFMHGKLQEEYAESSSMRHSSSTSAAARMSSSSPGLATIPSTDSDDIIAAAKAAAEEAQHISQQHKTQQRSWGGGLGGLFRARSGPGTGPGNSSSNIQPSGSNHSAHGGSSNASASSSHNMNEKTNNRPPVPTSITSNSFEERPNETPVERLQREQEQVKRAMAERQRQMMQHAPAHAPEAATSSSEPLGIPSYGESKPIAVIPVPGPTSSLSSRSVSLPLVASTFSRPVGTMSAAAMRTPAPPPPKKVTTPTDLFHEMMKEFRAKVVLSMDEVKRLRKHRSVLLEERFGTKAKERLAAQQKAQAEAQQMAAAEAEDFELADRMGSLIECHARECAEHKSILENIGRALVQLDSQKKSLVQDVTKCFSEIQGKLKAFQEQEESKESHDNTEALKRFSAISKQLSAENERLQQDLKHLEKDADAVAVERKELEKAISEQAGVFEKLRDEARTRLTTVEEEIEDLRKQLAAKVAVAAELRTEAAGHDESVLKVRVKFSRQLNRVQQKEMTIRDNREEWEFEKKSFESQKEVHDKEVAEHSEALLTRDQLLDSLKREIELADSFESIVSKEIGFEVSQDDAKEIDEELAQLQAEVSKSEAAVSESKEILKTAVAAIAALEEEKKATELRIPQLEEEKKAAAARRDFKAAGKASKEVKDSTTRLKEIELDLTGHVQERKEAAEAELIQLEQDLKVKRQVANEKEKEAGIAAMHRLADNIKRLLATKESVCAKGETSIQAVGSYVLDGQIEVLRLEGQTYGDKYGGWVELMSEIGLDHTAQDEQKVEEATNDNCHGEPEIVNQPSATPIPAATTDNGDITKQDSVEEVDPEVKKQAMARLCALMGEIGNTNVAIEAAAETEDFEKAAELDEELQRLLAAVENLGLTDDEMATALASKDQSSSAPEPAATTAADSSEEDPPVQTADDVAPASDSQQDNTMDQETSDIAPQQEATDGDEECKLESSNGCEPAGDKQTTMDDEDDEQIIEKEESDDFVQQESADDEQGELEPMNGNLDGEDNGETVEDKPMMDEHVPPIENCVSNDSADAAATLTDDDL